MKFWCLPASSGVSVCSASGSSTQGSTYARCILCMLLAHVCAMFDRALLLVLKITRLSAPTTEEMCAYSSLHQLYTRGSRCSMR